MKANKAKVKDKLKLNKSNLLFAAIGFVVGVLVVFSIRFITYSAPDQVHYHANFAMYINGQREEFKDPFYYQDIGSSCVVHEDITPPERVHMHDNINSVVHVHDNAVTWADFFANIGWVVDNNLIEDPHGKVYLADGQNQVRFILNGKSTNTVVNQVIGNENRLLIDFGNASAQPLEEEYKTVPATAHRYNVSKDPKSCGGAKSTTMGDRFKHMF